MISPAIAGNDSRCGIAACVFLGELSAINCQYPYPIAELPGKRGYRKLRLLKPCRAERTLSVPYPPRPCRQAEEEGWFVPRR
jgi:hypothetical protein